MGYVHVGHGFHLPQDYWTCEYQDLFPQNFLRILAHLVREMGPARDILLMRRKDRQRQWDSGVLPDFPDQTTEAVTGDWKVDTIPPELTKRRVEITGPVNSAKMVINMLSRNEKGARADMAMLDFEDSMKPSFCNVIDGYRNVIGAVEGTLTAEAGGKTYRLNPDDMAYVMVRVRGLHLNESNMIFEGDPVPAGLLDLAVCFYHTACLYLEKNLTPKYYVPKCEHYLEARWWNDLFVNLQTAMGLPTGTLKATFLIETLPATLQVEEILYEIREHAAGLNVGRWDKIFSDIKVLGHHEDRILGDRSSITMEKSWMENYAKRVIKICHERGAFAMGGMSAFTPGKTAELREEQSSKVRKDKEREAAWGHDGCWVSHPYFIDIAMSAFKKDNQLDVTLPDFDKYSDVLPRGEGPYTMQGLRTNVRVGIAYMEGWERDIGCVSFDNLMEDLATLEISRAQVWQWLHHGITLDSGEQVTSELVNQIFDEERNKMANEFPEVEWHEAANKARHLFLRKELQEFLTTESDPVTSTKGIETWNSSNELPENFSIPGTMIRGGEVSRGTTVP
ncbi:MAG: malate synthase [Bacteriovoracaceae bacterium]